MDEKLFGVSYTGNMTYDNLDIIEDYLLENGCDIENYTDPEKGICQLEAVLDELKKLIEYKYMYLDLCK